MRTRTVTLADIAQHPHRSLSPHDYIYETGDAVVFQGADHLVVRQDDNDLWLAQVDYVPGTKAIFSCRVPTEPTATIFEVTRPKR